MIAYLPILYPDELFYSWVARLYCHTTPTYINTIEDVFCNRYVRPDVEFIGKLNSEVLTLVNMDDLIINHTLFPQYRFTHPNRLKNAYKEMKEQHGDIHTLLPYNKNANKKVIKYCPLCARESQEENGEAYWNRKHIIRGVDICINHKCRLVKTKIEISGRMSPRPFIAEENISFEKISYIEENSFEFRFTKYMVDVFETPINIENKIAIGDYLSSKLEGTSYLSIRGKKRNLSKLQQDIRKEMRGVSYIEIDICKLQKIFSNKSFDFLAICEIAFFLGITPQELANPKLPMQTQYEIYDKKVNNLYLDGKGCHVIARELGGSKATVVKSHRKEERKPHDYSVRKGILKDDWNKMDEENKNKIKQICEEMLNDKDGRPQRVTINKVCNKMGWPSKRMDYLPTCKEIVNSYVEEYPYYWAREVVWAYKLVNDRGDELNWRRIRDITNLSRENFEKSFPYLLNFCDKDIEMHIKNILL